MKVLYIGNYNDGTGWGNACLNNILALDRAGIDVVFITGLTESFTKSEHSVDEQVRFCFTRDLRFRENGVAHCGR